jgi:parvulin-like peptidyl-prolyl isomerase
MTPRRSLRFVALAATAAVFTLVGSACSDTLEDAASADDTHITSDTLHSEIEELIGNERLASDLESQFDISDDGATVDAQLTAAWLSFLVQQVAIDAEFEAQGLRMTDEVRDQGLEALNQQFGEETVSEFPDSFRERLIERYGRLAALSGAFTVDPAQPTADDAREFYEQNREALFACPSARSVSHIVVATEAEANDVLAQLQGGADFATVASERSTDAASAQDGGLVPNPQGPRGCYAQGQDAALDAAVDAAAEGQPTGPVQTAAGYEVIVVTPYTPPPFEQVEQELLTQLQAQAQQTAQSESANAFNEALSGRLQDMDVWVSPRYGRWVADDEGARVVAPDSPDPRGTRNVPPETTAPTDPLGQPVPGADQGG